MSTVPARAPFASLLLALLAGAAGGYLASSIGRAPSMAAAGTPEPSPQLEGIVAELRAIRAQLERGGGATAAIASPAGGARTAEAPGAPAPPREPAPAAVEIPIARGVPTEGIAPPSAPRHSLTREQIQEVLDQFRRAESPSRVRADHFGLGYAAILARYGVPTAVRPHEGTQTWEYTNDAAGRNWGFVVNFNDGFVIGFEFWGE